MFNFTLHVCKNFHVVNIEVLASVGALPLDGDKGMGDLWLIMVGHLSLNGWGIYHLMVWTFMA